jgi:hypothetical protein
MLVVGPERWSGYLAGRFFGGPAGVRKLIGRVNLWQAPAVLATWRERVDVVCARVDRFSAARLAEGHHVRVPEWIRMVAAVPPAGTTFASRQARRHARLVERHGLTWRVSHDPDDVERFFVSDYTPFIRRRHGADARPRSSRSLRAALRGGGLVWVERGGEAVAGLVYDIRDGALRRVASACARGDESLLAIGAIAATHLAAFAIARAAGCREIDMGFCRPCLADGLFQVKQAWGGMIVDSPEVGHDFLLGWRRLTPAVDRFLAESPLVVRHGRGSAAVVAGESGGQPRRAPPGIAGFIRPRPGGEFGDWEEPSPPEPGRSPSA